MVETTSIGRRRIGRHCAVLIGLWALVGLAQVLSPLLPPPEFFCYRAWECALGHDRPFIPWYVWRAPASGDLSHTAGAPQLNRFRAQTFTTDEYGFRDRVGQADRHPDVVIVGDSFAAGAAVSDGELLDAMIEKETGLVVYNLATLRLRNFYTDQRFLDHPPRWVIAFHVERDLAPENFVLLKGDKPWTPQRFADRAAYDRSLRPGVRGRWKQANENMNYHSLLSFYGERGLKGLLWKLRLYDFPEQIGHYDPTSGFLFYAQSVRQQADPSDKLRELPATVGAMRDAERKLAARGIRLIVLVAPDKEDIYHLMIPALRGRDTGVYLERLETELTRLGVTHVPTQRLLAAHLSRRPYEILYFPDDTHLTPLGHRVLMSGLMPLLQADVYPKR